MKSIVTRVAKRTIPARFMRALQQFYYAHGNLRFELATGVRVEVLSHVDWCIYNELFVDCEYDLPIDRVVQSVGIHANVLDLGANVGFFALRLLDRLSAADVKTVVNLWAVEPDECNVRELTRRVGLQQSAQLSRVNLQVACGLAGRREGEVIFYESHRYHASSVKKSQHLCGAREVKHHYVDIDRFAPDIAWDLVKCDIEGSEGDFVANYEHLLQRTRVFVVEFHANACDPDDIRRRLSQVGLTFEGVLAARAGNEVLMFHRGS